MMVLTKKKILYILGIIIFSILTYTIIGINVIKSSKRKTIETAALPANNKVIIIDAGHGIPDERSPKFKSEQQKLRVI